MEYFDDITIALVLYNSEEVIENCLQLFSQDQKIIAIDNASTDASATLVSQLHPQARIIKNDVNRGFGRAVNQAVTFADTPYVLLLNPDAIMNSGAISRLFEFAEKNPNTSIVAPYLTIPNRGLELDLRGPEGAEYNVPMTIPEGPFSTWFATGAVWLARVSDWLELGGFDEGIFLYGEDLDFCFRLRNAGKTIVICPDSRGIHLLSKSTKATKKIKWRKEWNIIWSHLYVTQKHFGKIKTKAEISRLFWRHFPKMLFHGLVLERKRFQRDFAIVHAVISFIFGHMLENSNHRS